MNEQNPDIELGDKAKRVIRDYAQTVMRREADAMARTGYAAGLRALAASLSQQASALAGQARDAMELAGRVELGDPLVWPPRSIAQATPNRDDPPGAGEPDDGSGDDESDERAPLVERIEMDDDHRGSWVGSGRPLSVGMVEFIDSFSERFTAVPAFAVAVAEAAEQGMVQDEAAREWIAQRVNELEG